MLRGYMQDIRTARADAVLVRPHTHGHHQNMWAILPSLPSLVDLSEDLRWMSVRWKGHRRSRPLLLGGHADGGQPQLEPLARGLAEAWQPIALGMKLDMRAEVNGEQVTMHCVLRNISASEIDVDQESLPWNNADAFKEGTACRWSKWENR